MEAKVDKFRPLPGKVVVELAKAAEQTQSGLYLPENARDQMNQGRVLAVAEGFINDEGNEIFPLVNIGDFVVFGRFAGTELVNKSDRGRQLIVLRESDILTVVDYVFAPKDDVVQLELVGEKSDVVGEAPFPGADDAL